MMTIMDRATLVAVLDFLKKRQEFANEESENPLDSEVYWAGRVDSYSDSIKWAEEELRRLEVQS